MHTKSTLVLLAAALTFSPLAARAQTNTLPPGGFPRGGSQGGLGGGGLQNGGRGIMAKPAWMSNRVSLNVKDANAQKAVREVLDKAGVKTYTFELNNAIYLVKDGKIDPNTSSELDRLYANPVTLTMQSVTAEDALKRISDAAGVGIRFHTEDNQLTVSVMKTAAGYGSVYNISPKSSIDPAIASALNQAAQTTRDVQMFYTAPTMVTMQLNNTLPDTRVGLDVRDGDLRDTLKNVLKQANLDYALEDDVPETQKRSFTFENVPVGTALDVICKSADIGWRAETHSGKTLVRVGKKYASKPIAPPVVDRLFVTPKPAR